MLTGKRTAAEIARTEKIKDSLLYKWRTDALEKLPLVFSMGTPDRAQSEREKELEQLIGQLTIENQALKKASRWLSGLSHKNDQL
jgi:transposase-like protein